MDTIRKFAFALSAVLILITATGNNVRAAENNTDTEAAGKEEVSEEAASVPADCPYVIRTDSEENYVLDKRGLHLYSGRITLSMAPGTKKSDLYIDIGGDCTLILDGVNIESKDSAAMKVRTGVHADIVLAKGDGSGKKVNTFKGAEGYAGIEVKMSKGQGAAPHVSSNLRISGDGILKAVGGAGGAGIGSCKGQDSCGMIIIEQGNITAIGGSGADGIGCGSDNAMLPVSAPRISDDVQSLYAAADGTGTAVLLEAAGIKSDTEDDFTDAYILRGTFANSEDGSLSGLKKVNITDAESGDVITFDMPDGYRDFAVKTTKTGEYTIGQKDRLFAVSENEMFTEEIKKDKSVQLEFAGSDNSVSPGGYLVPVKDAEQVDVDVTGAWDDGNDRDGTRPQSIEIALYANGVDTGRTIVLNEENGWSGTFASMSLYKNDERQSYSIVEERLEGYTGSISGSDEEGYTITNIHKPLPAGRGGSGEMTGAAAKRETVVSTIVTSKVATSMPVRTSTTIEKTMSAKTSDSSSTFKWGAVLLCAVAALFIWMKIEQKKD